uniref:Uncharacterized protein n=1 Tax=Strix occidentalis caurina TaxID=311401 RepID=A0A8D0G3K0_STROC
EFHHHDDQTPLHISARLGKADIVQQLLQQGASPNAATTSGYTPLHLSAREGHEDVASVLLDHGIGLCLAREGLQTCKGSWESADLLPVLRTV